MPALTFVILLATSGFRSTPGVLIVPLQEEFGWDRATISLAVSINLILPGFIGLFAGTTGLMEGILQWIHRSLDTSATSSTPHLPKDVHLRSQNSHASQTPRKMRFGTTCKRSLMRMASYWPKMVMLSGWRTRSQRPQWYLW